MHKLNPVIHHITLNDYLSDKLEDLNCDDNVKNYIIGIFLKYKTSYYDLSKESIGIQYSIAILNNNFEKFQTLADWLFFSKSMYPESLNNASENYYNSLGQLSYFSCYRIIKEWKIYEELSDRFIELADNSNKLLK